MGAVIVGANVTLTDASGVEKKTTTNAEGVYTYAGLAPGKYSLKANATGFAPSEDKQIDVTGGRQSADLTLKVTIEEKVTVQETPISTEATNNANQTVIAGKDLDALPDDPDELAAALQARLDQRLDQTADRSSSTVSPAGVFLERFDSRDSHQSESVCSRERSTFGPYRHPDAPGTDKFRGGTSFNFTDESFNSRNPFAIASSKRTPFQIRQFDVNLSGPVVKQKASFFVNFGRAETDDNELIRATVLDDNLNIVDLGTAFLTPKRNTFFSPRFDYAINNNHTLVARYNFNRFTFENQGVGGFSLPERGFDTVVTNHTIQLTETAILNPTTINETRFQFLRSRNDLTGNNRCLRSTSVLHSTRVARRSAIHSTNAAPGSLNNFTAKQMGTHAIKFGGRLRHINLNDTNEGNFGGTWSFTGGFGLTSIERYQLTLRLQDQGLTPEQIREAGGGAATFSINPETHLLL